MSSTFAYVGSRTTRERNARGKGIGVYRIDSASSTWEPLQMMAALENPSFLTLNQAQSVLYTVHGDGEEVSSFAVDAVTGRLSELNRLPCAGINPVHLAVSRSGDALYVANYASGSAVRLPILSGGSLGRADEPIAFPGEAGSHRVEQTASHPHHIARFSTKTWDSDWHIVPDKGLDTVFAIRFAAVEGEPEIVSQRVREGAGPRHAAPHPFLRKFYVANELDASVTAFAFDISNGTMQPEHTLSIVPGSYHGVARAAGIVVSPCGNWLYVSIRGLDAIATVSLHHENGNPLFVQWTPAEGSGPRFICLTNDGSTLYAANELSDSIIQFALDASSGLPQSTGYRIATASPVCIVFKDHQE